MERQAVTREGVAVINSCGPVVEGVGSRLKGCVQVRGVEVKEHARNGPTLLARWNASYSGGHPNLRLRGTGGFERRVKPGLINSRRDCRR